MDFQQFVARVAKTAKVRERSLFVQAKGWVARDLLGQVDRIVFHIITFAA